MPKPAIRSSIHNHPELAVVLAENDRLRQEIAELKAQIAAIHVGVKAVLDAIALPDIDRPN